MAIATTNLNQTAAVPGMSRQSQISLSVFDKLSNSSLADDCYTNQRFSQKLQAFMAAYVSQVENGVNILSVQPSSTIPS